MYTFSLSMHSSTMVIIPWKQFHQDSVCRQTQFAILVRGQFATHLLLKEVLSVAEGAKLGLLLFVFQLLLRRPEVEDEILKGENDALQRK